MNSNTKAVAADFLSTQAGGQQRLRAAAAAGFAAALGLPQEVQAACWSVASTPRRCTAWCSCGRPRAVLDAGDLLLIITKGSLRGISPAVRAAVEVALREILIDEAA